MSIFGWDLPPGCTTRHIEDAMGVDPPEHCLNPACSADLTEENDPDFTGVCSAACVWPAISATAQADADRAASENAMALEPAEWE